MIIAHRGKYMIAGGNQVRRVMRRARAWARTRDKDVEIMRDGEPRFILRPDGRLIEVDGAQLRLF